MNKQQSAMTIKEESKPATPDLELKEMAKAHVNLLEQQIEPGIDATDMKKYEEQKEMGKRIQANDSPDSKKDWRVQFIRKPPSLFN